MDIFAAKQYRNYFLLGLLLTVLTAYFSIGYHHPDEHYQVFEFANYKMGYSPTADLTWEFAAQCRPALQPFIVFCLCKTLVIIHLYNPFVVAFLVRLLMGIATWWLSCKLILFLLPSFKTEIGKKSYVWCSMFLWFIPYINVRFSAENIAGVLLFIAALLLLKMDKNPSEKKVSIVIAIGLLLGFSLYLRIQIAFALIGLGLWILLKQKWVWKNYVQIIIAGLFAIGICLIVDRWFYGNWVLTPFNYYKVNIIQHKAAEFGVSPWWYYITSFLTTAVPPISIVLLCFFCIGIAKIPMHLLSAILITFLLGHFFIGHKELRFIFPIIYAFIFFVAIGIDNYFVNRSFKPFYRWTFRVLLFMNGGLLLFRIFSPAQEAMKYYSFIYDEAEKENVTLIAFDKSPYNSVGAETNFYKPKNLKISIIKNAEEIKGIYENKGHTKVLFFSPTLYIPKEMSEYKLEKLYCLLPYWVLNFNFNHWEDRSNIGVIYLIKTIN